jgi:formate/nitrite transporter
MGIACCERKIKPASLLRNWFFVYAGNMMGSVMLAYFIYRSGQLDFSGGMLGGFTLKLASYKTGMSFSHAFFLGILCNWLVCLAVWMAAAANDVTGKLLAIFFPIWLFITSGFEHCVANMYYIPAGIFSKSVPRFVEQAIHLGASAESIASLGWGTFVINNLVPVTAGNIVGGGFFVGLTYWFVYRNKGKD